MSALATGEVIETRPAFRTLPVIVMGALGTEIVGVTAVSETVRGGLRAATGAPATPGASAAAAVAAGAGERTESSEAVSNETASTVAEAACRHTLAGMIRPVTSPPPGAPTRDELSAAHWGR